MCLNYIKKPIYQPGSNFWIQISILDSVGNVVARVIQYRKARRCLIFHLDTR